MAEDFLRSHLNLAPANVQAGMDFLENHIRQMGLGLSMADLYERVDVPVSPEERVQMLSQSLLETLEHRLTNVA